MRRIILPLLLIIALLIPGMVLAEPANQEVPEAIAFDGSFGVVNRVQGQYRSRALLKELDVAYVDAGSEILKLGETAEWTAHATGGDGRYEYEFVLYHNDGQEELFYYYDRQLRSPSNHFESKIRERGRYWLILHIYDDSGSSIEYQGPTFECAAPEDYSNPDTVAGKVELLAKQCMEEAGSSDYARAMWMHDWLARNACYDHSFTYYDADGVLLRGTGVCNSYALAYQILMERLGINSIYVVGQAGGLHAWNLIHLDGQWVHVDCTWDDPDWEKEGRYDYFCLSDEQMAKDHEWHSEWAHLPEGETDEYSFFQRVSIPVAHSRRELYALLLDMARNRAPYLEYVDEIDEEYALWDVWSEVVAETGVHYTGGSHVIYGDIGYAAVDYGSGYPAVPQATSLRLETEQLLLNAGESYRVLAFCSPLKVHRMQESGEISWGSVSQWEYNVQWSSSNPAIASVKDGRVTALNPGLALITARSGSVSDTLPVLVIRESTGLTAQIPASVKAIESEAFLNDTGLSRIIFDEDCTLSIGSRAFAGCSGVDLVYIPAGVTEIADDAFDGCGAVMLCPEGSAAQRYAEKHGMPVFTMDHYAP